MVAAAASLAVFAALGLAVGLAKGADTTELFAYLLLLVAMPSLSDLIAAGVEPLTRPSEWRAPAVNPETWQ